jgi:RNA polymerase sigma-70 factor (ECF subfamily)
MYLIKELGAIQKILLYRARSYYPRDINAAQDLVQDTNLVITKKINLFKPGEDLKGSMINWSFTIMRNLFIDQVRHTHNRMVVYDGEKIEDTDIVQETNEKSPLLKPVRVYIRSIKSYKTRSVLMMRLMGLSYAEISDSTGYSIGNIKSIIFRGKEMVKEKFGEKINNL